MEKNITITDIEEMTEQDLRAAYAPNFEAIPIKGYTVYLVDVAGRFGYSMIVFGDGRQIIWANDYELHWDYYMKDHTRDDLRDKFIRKAESILFTEEELAEPLKSYHDYEQRRKYIMELLPLRRDFMSMFQLQRTEEEKQYVREMREAHPVVCHAACGYFAEEDRDFAQHITDLLDRLGKQEADTANNYDYQYSAFYYELGNHEYHINNYQGNWDVLSAFGNIPWRGQSEEALVQYFDDLHFTETQRKAFYDARRQFLKDADEKGWY